MNRSVLTRCWFSRTATGLLRLHRPLKGGHERLFVVRGLLDRIGILEGDLHCADILITWWPKKQGYLAITINNITPF